MRRRVLAVAAVVASAFLPAPAAPDAPPVPIWVFLRDKDAAAGSPASSRSGDDALAERARALSPRSLARRRATRGDRVVDERDLDLSAGYVAAIEATGAHVRAKSRWLNAVSVVASAPQLAAIERLPQVIRTQPVARRSARPPPVTPPASRAIPPQPAAPGDYGVAFDQLDLIGVPALHDCGLTGAGVVVAVLDSGFWLGHEALASVDVVAQHDFIHDDDVTSDEANDTPGQHNHGTSVLALMAGNAPGKYMGPAPGVSVILAKTEDISVEQPVEEDWFVEGLEWAEGLGADLATASLGYIDWYTPADFDGKTAVTTVAANVAMQNGLIMIAAAGNWGPAPSTIGAPADADGLIAVGAVDVAGTLADFSSRGPTADGRIKPDVSAPGKDDWVVVPGTPDGYAQGNGTSYATPLVAGVVALLVQAYPKLGPKEMLALLTSTASQAAAPANDYGWGVVDGYAAAGLFCTCHDVDGDEAFDAACGGDDCDDSAAAVHPGAAEVCDGLDDDCDGDVPVDESDADVDGVLGCAGDCDDGDEAVGPGATEICDDGIDNDCDGSDAPCDVVADGGSGGGGGAGSSAAAASNADRDLHGSCGCRVAGGDASGASVLALAIAALAAAWRRRRA